LVSDSDRGRCQQCGRTQLLRQDGTVIKHGTGKYECPGTGKEPAEDVAVASWLPVLRGLTPHGLRHGHQTWMDELAVPYVLQAERMGHEVPGMRGVYAHVSDEMRQGLVEGLEKRWERSLHARAEISPRSAVPTLDALLQAL